jgi:hypothetical protein
MLIYWNLVTRMHDNIMPRNSSKLSKLQSLLTAEQNSGAIAKKIKNRLCSGNGSHNSAQNFCLISKNCKTEKYTKEHRICRRQFILWLPPLQLGRWKHVYQITRHLNQRDHRATLSVVLYGNDTSPLILTERHPLSVSENIWIGLYLDMRKRK